MKRVARFDFLIEAGVVSATLSSAMASFLGAPRILQSLAGDRIFPFLTPFAKGVGPANNPRRGVLLSLSIAVINHRPRQSECHCAYCFHVFFDLLRPAQLRHIL